MYKELKTLINIQELDIKMIRLMRIKRQRQNELRQVASLRTELHDQLALKEQEMDEFDKQISALEEKLSDLANKYKELESRQVNVKKVEEFNALTREMTTMEREKISLENQISNILDKKNSEEEVLKKIKESFKTSEANSQDLEKEIFLSIDKINAEGQKLKHERDDAIRLANPELLVVYERLLRNKKDRVIVPIENRTCSGCHITLTLQHENLVRKKDSLVFCEHCSRIHFWQESEGSDGKGDALVKRRRRRRIVQT